MEKVYASRSFFFSSKQRINVSVIDFKLGLVLFLFIYKSAFCSTETKLIDYLLVRLNAKTGNERTNNLECN